MSFDIKEYQETAWTPEIGGDFGEFQLLLKMRTPQMKQALLAHSMRDDFTYDKQILAAKAIDYVLELIVGWKGAKQEFSEKLRDHGLVHMLNGKTGITLKGKEEPATLQDYISDFAGDPENFLAV